MSLCFGLFGVGGRELGFASSYSWIDWIYEKDLVLRLHRACGGSLKLRKPMLGVVSREGVLAACVSSDG